jgi:ketosteroid isomerase-like protein
MSGAKEIVQEAYALAKRGDHRQLRRLIADDATWHPAREGLWNPCRDADMIVKTLVWRAGMANRFKPADPIEVGGRVVIRLRGVRLGRFGSRGFRPRLFQIIDVRDGKIVQMQDFAKREDALAAAGLRP